MTKFALTGLEGVARRSRSVQRNAEVIRRAQAGMRGNVSREEVLEALRAGRGG